MNGGILIIGSLLWDPDQGTNKGARKKWRTKRLNMDKKIHVFAPIRYGRLSNEQSYTMVFSKEVENNKKLGTAYIIPFKNNPVTWKGLLYQARYLSTAERANDNKLVKGNKEKWCIIGILFNPKFGQAQKDDILRKFRKELEKDEMGENHQNLKAGGESSILKETGEIDIEWIKAVNPILQKELDQLDFILATCTQPKPLASYPNSSTIKNALNNDTRNYFYNNIQFGITTFQDREIILK
ncbi:hypothetical protein [Agriterribacter sp.]|uniref:hypothetical protein n=1 Tax=Agriterribacter sp. TaxID=2821509 RepID=UPI002C35119A|nr:hypothetical protein [Agriterribacter sp.]HRO45987.1 hypothetical protein [Agriterribacter sp.]HRQ17024.1 hypothetical protein [Agriterribacter sp.]